MATERTPQSRTMDYQINLWGCLLLVCSFFYALLLFLIYYAWQKGSTKHYPIDAPVDFPFISIIIPARNEAVGIMACVEAILMQDYPTEKMEILVIDDHSEDKTAELLKKNSDDRLKVWSLTQESIKGKKAALQFGVAQSTGDFIITTDADCIAPRGWLSAFATAWCNEEELLLAPVRIRPQAGFLNAFQGLDVAGTLLLTGASVYWPKPILANGANFGFTKRVFQVLNGYQGNEDRASGDDVFLLQKAVHANRSVAFLYQQEALVDTSAEESWQGLFWQRLRWAGKVDAYQDKYLLIFQAFVFMYCALLCLLPFRESQHHIFLLLGWGIKVFADLFFLSYACREIGDHRWMRWFLPAQLLHTIYVFLLGCLALMPLKFYWKGRLVR